MSLTDHTKADFLAAIRHPGYDGVPPHQLTPHIQARGVGHSLAAFKRQVRVGTVLQCEHHERPQISGPRPVVKVQANAISYTFARPGCDKAHEHSQYCTQAGEIIGWCHWPKASESRINEDGSLTFLRDGKPIFTYRLPEACHCGRTGHTPNTCDPVGPYA
jgi:hypothetical protein